MSHPLNTPWTFYFLDKQDKKNVKESYEDFINKIGKVFTVEEFWNYYSHIVHPDSLPPSVTLHFFRNDSRAMWEDPENSEGGSFFCQVAKKQTKFLWERLLVNLIGEQFPSNVIGVTVTTKPRFDVICVWNQTAADDTIRMDICKKLVEIFEMPPNSKITYNFFNQDSKFSYMVENDNKILVKPIEPKNKTWIK